MPTSQIKITYAQRTNGESGAATRYFMRATVDAFVTTPDALKKCLVVYRGTLTDDEIIVGVGTQDQIVIEASRLPELPATVNMFDSATLPSSGIAVGDIIRLNAVPERWYAYELAPNTTYDAIVAEVAPGGNTQRVRVVTPFPAFGRQMSFKLIRDTFILVTGEDGTANRDYTGLAGPEYRTSTGLMTFEDDLDAAQAWKISADSSASELVRTYDTDNYSRDFEEFYE